MQSWKTVSAAIAVSTSCLISIQPAAAAPMIAAAGGREDHRRSSPAAGSRAISSLAWRIPQSRLALSPALRHRLCRARRASRWRPYWRGDRQQSGTGQ